MDAVDPGGEHFLCGPRMDVKGFVPMSFLPMS